MKTELLLKLENTLQEFLDLYEVNEEYYLINNEAETLASFVSGLMDVMHNSYLDGVEDTENPIEEAPAPSKK